MTTEQKISARILTLIANGMTPDAAFDSVIGEGSFKRLADAIWEKNNAK